MSKKKDNKIWKDRKRNWCGLPWTFTIYSFDEERVYVEQGVLNKRLDECRMYRILDLSVTRSFGQRIFGMGTIHVHSSDRSLKDFEIKNVKHVMDVKEQLSELVEQMRDKKRVTSREFIHDSDHDYDHDDHDGYDDDDYDDHH